MIDLFFLLGIAKGASTTQHSTGASKVTYANITFVVTIVVVNVASQWDRLFQCMYHKRFSVQNKIHIVTVRQNTVESVV